MERPKPQAQGFGLGLQSVFAAIGIAGIIGLTHAADQDADPAPHGQSRGDREEDQIARRHEGGRQAVFAKADLGLSRQRAFGQIAIAGQVYDTVVAEFGRPGREALRHRLTHRVAGLHLHMVALAIFEADGFNAVKPVQRPGQTGSRILSAREQDQGGGIAFGVELRASHGVVYSISNH
jgi:hypothetical protein